MKINSLGELNTAGDLYCGARCGCGCTRESYDRAVRDAAALVERLGAGWEAEVWENCAWHYRAQCGDLEVRPNHPQTGYTAILNLERQFLADAEKPEDAIGFVIQDARSFLSRMESSLHTLLERSA